MKQEYLNSAQEKMEKAITNLEDKFKNVRAGRANPNMLDNIKVSYYGTPTPLKQLATVFVPTARQINVKPFDKTLLSEIEKAIYDAELGITPNNNGEMIFLSIQPLTEERRKELVKQVKEISEEIRISVRNIRKDINDQIKKDEFSEDEGKNLSSLVQDVVNETNKKVEELLKEKEKDLMEI
jgi:ribosome recycling factor